MDWTTRLMEIDTMPAGPDRDRARAAALRDANDPQTCLIGEAGRRLGGRYVYRDTRGVLHTKYIETSDALEALINAHASPVGGLFPTLISFDRLPEAIDLCLHVEDALLTLKRDASASADESA